MKVTINLISNIFIAGIVSILPYLSMIRGAIGSENSNILLYLPVMILPFVTYIISAFGLEMAEQGYKGRKEKSAVSTIYFIMLISTIIVPYILAMAISFVGSSAKDVAFIIFLLLFSYTFYLFLRGKKFAVIFLLPLLIYKIYEYVSLYMKVYVTTKNKGKIKEINKILQDAGIVCESFPNMEDVEETGETFEENAKIKADYLSSKLKDEYVISDDSGLSCEALGGAPGVYSARYAGNHGDDEANNKKLLQEMQNKDNRNCKYECVIALSKNGKTIKTFYGEIKGSVAFEKNKVSHRYIALNKLMEYLASI